MPIDELAARRDSAQLKDDVSRMNEIMLALDVHERRALIAAAEVVRELAFMLASATGEEYEQLAAVRSKLLATLRGEG